MDWLKPLGAKNYWLGAIYWYGIITSFFIGAVILAEFISSISKNTHVVLKKVDNFLTTKSQKDIIKECYEYAYGTPNLGNTQEWVTATEYYYKACLRRNGLEPGK